MASSGEVNGTAVIISNATGEIVGQGSMTHTFNGALIDTSNKSNGDVVTYMSGELSGKQHVFSGEFTYNDDAQFRAVRAAVFAGTSAAYTVTIVSDATTDESFTGNFIPTGLSDTFNQGEKVTCSISFNSDGVVTVTPAS